MRTAIILAIALALVACGKKSDDKKKADPAGKPTEVKKDPAGDKDKPAEPAGGALTLTKYNLKMDAPAGSAVEDAIVGEGHMVQGPDLVVTVEEASESRPATAEKAQEEAADYTPENAKIEALADGWILTFENKGGMGTNYFVQSRREIGGKAYWCETTASKPEQQTNAVAACKSLKQ